MPNVSRGRGSHGATWRIGSAQVQPYHTTECSISQSYDGDGALYLYTRIWAHRKGEPRRGIAKSTDVRNPSNLLSFAAEVAWGAGRGDVGRGDSARPGRHRARLRSKTRELLGLVVPSR